MCQIWCADYSLRDEGDLIFFHSHSSSSGSQCFGFFGCTMELEHILIPLDQNTDSLSFGELS